MWAGFYDPSCPSRLHCFEGENFRTCCSLIRPIEPLRLHVLHASLSEQHFGAMRQESIRILRNDPQNDIFDILKLLSLIIIFFMRLTSSEPHKPWRLVDPRSGLISGKMGHVGHRT